MRSTWLVRHAPHAWLVVLTLLVALAAHTQPVPVFSDALELIVTSAE